MFSSFRVNLRKSLLVAAGVFGVYLLLWPSSLYRIYSRGEPDEDDFYQLCQENRSDGTEGDWRLKLIDNDHNRYLSRRKDLATSSESTANVTDPRSILEKEESEKDLFKNAIKSAWIKGHLTKRYIALKWDGNGFGNQMRGFISCIIYSLLTNRSFIFNYPKFHTYFHLPKIIEGYTFSMKTIMNTKSLTRALLDKAAVQRWKTSAVDVKANISIYRESGSHFALGAFTEAHHLTKLRSILFNNISAIRFAELLLNFLLNCPAQRYLSRVNNAIKSLGLLSLSNETETGNLLILIQSRAWRDEIEEGENGKNGGKGRAEETEVLTCLTKLLLQIPLTTESSAINFEEVSKARKTFFITSDSMHRVKQMADIAGKHGRTVYSTESTEHWHSSKTKANEISTGLIDWLIMALLPWDYVICHGTTFCKSAMALHQFRNIPKIASCNPEDRKNSGIFIDPSLRFPLGV